MRILVTGADQTLGRSVARHLDREHTLRLIGRSNLSVVESEYQQVDLRSAQGVASIVVDVDAILHLAEFDPEPRGGLNAEQDLLEHATLGTYILCQEARRAGVERIVIASILRLFDTYPHCYLVDEMWKPQPEANAEHLAPYLCEKIGREFAREGGIRGICLRFAPIGDDPERNTRLADALHAIDCALALHFETPGYRWHLFHIASSPRFILRNARVILGFQPQEER